MNEDVNESNKLGNAYDPGHFGGRKKMYNGPRGFDGAMATGEDIINNELDLDMLNLFKDKPCDGIHVQWRMYGDNNLLYYDDRSVFERFYNKKNESSSTLIKTILKCLISKNLKLLK